MNLMESNLLEDSIWKYGIVGKHILKKCLPFASYE